MKKFTKFLVILALLPMLFLSSCKEDDDATGADNPAFEALQTYLVDNQMDLNQIISTTENGKFATKTLTDKYIIDIRSAADFATGHLEGAVNSTLANILETAKAANNPILVVCYTGQTAARAVVALRLSGFPKAALLKWGMSGQGNTGPWDSNIGDAAKDHANWTSDAPVNPSTYPAPVLYTTATEGAAILKERVQAMLENTAWSVKNPDVLATPANYQINNYFSEGDWNAFGHFKGAHRLNPLTVNGSQVFNLDPNQTIVTYCYTGQTSSIITAYLHVLGYDKAKSLLFGMNGLQNTHSQWTENSAITGNQWVQGAH
ncbi:rhodanese-like domain-containing protein [Ancylomarina sp.]|uniref:rhodanese-like domain-containing protein n=1 Tax=Ancylomarina sp. TaxID=1970196 RepID=UPI003566230C